MVGLAAGDIILLFFDGLTGCVPEEDIAGALNRVQTADASCRRLVEAALDRGGPDNVSVVVVQADRQGPS